jgi:hypothetical protein
MNSACLNVAPAEIGVYYKFSTMTMRNTRDLA